MLYKRMFILLIASAVLFSAVSANADFKMGDRLVIDAGDTVKDAVCLGDDVYVFGTVKDNAVSLGGNIVIGDNGLVRGDVVSLGGDVRVQSDGVIKGNAVSIGGHVRVDSGGYVHGDKVELPRVPAILWQEVHRPFCSFGESFGHTLSGIFKTIFLGPFIGAASLLGFFIVTILLLLKLLVRCGITALLTYLLPRHVNNMAVCARDHLLKAFIVGFISIIIIPFLFIFLAVSLIGIPLIPLVIFLLFIAYLFGSVGISLWVGRLLPISEHRTDMHNALLGVLVIGLVCFIPVIGLLAGIIAGMTAVGVIILTRFGAELYK